MCDPELQAVIDRAVDLSAVHFKVQAAGANYVNIVALASGQEDWTLILYRRLNNAMQAAAEQLGVSIMWGGDKPDPQYWIWHL